MHSTKRVVMALPRLRCKNDSTLVYFAHPYAHQGPNGRRRQLALLYGLEIGQAAEHPANPESRSGIFPAHNTRPTHLNIAHHLSPSLKYQTIRSFLTP